MPLDRGLALSFFARRPGGASKEQRSGTALAATQRTRTLGRFLAAPSIILLFIWMIVPLGMTVYFSLTAYNLLNPGSLTFIGFENFQFFLTDPAFLASLLNTLILVGSVLIITVVLGVLIALLLD